MILYYPIDQEVLDLVNINKDDYRNILSELSYELAILICIMDYDEYIGIPPTYWYESNICRELLIINREYVYKRYIALVLDEISLRDFIEVKKERYKRLYSTEKYREAYYANKDFGISRLNAMLIKKGFSVGSESFKLWNDYYNNRFNVDLIEDMRWYELTQRLIETERESFLWESVLIEAGNSGYTDNEILKMKIREVMTLSYLIAHKSKGIILPVGTRIGTSIIKPNTNDCYNLLRWKTLFSITEFEEIIKGKRARDIIKIKESREMEEYIKIGIQRLNEGVSTGAIADELSKKIDISALKRRLNRMATNSEKERNITAKTERRKDIAIITVKKEEYRALINECDYENEDSNIEGEINMYSWKEMKIISKAGECYDIVVGMTAQPTNITSAIAIMETYRQWRPRYIILTGIAAGNEEMNVKAGDVVVSKVIWAFEYGRMGKKFEPRMLFVYKTDRHVLAHCEAYEINNDNWYVGIKGTKKQKPKVHKGIIIAGDKTIEAMGNEMMKRIFDKWQEIMAIEMEGGGCGEAINTLRERGEAVGFVLVKGISDVPRKEQERENQRKRKQMTRRASEVAARYVVGAIKEGWPRNRKT